MRARGVGFVLVAAATAVTLVAPRRVLAQDAATAGRPGAERVARPLPRRLGFLRVVVRATEGVYEIAVPELVYDAARRAGGEDEEPVVVCRTPCRLYLPRGHQRFMVRRPGGAWREHDLVVRDPVRVFVNDEHPVRYGIGRAMTIVGPVSVGVGMYLGLTGVCAPGACPPGYEWRSAAGVVAVVAGAFVTLTGLAIVLMSRPMEFERLRTRPWPARASVGIGPTEGGALVGVGARF